VRGNGIGQSADTQSFLHRPRAQLRAFTLPIYYMRIVQRTAREHLIVNALRIFNIDNGQSFSPFAT
jgi:hypothetical protein